MLGRQLLHEQLVPRWRATPTSRAGGAKPPEQALGYTGEDRLHPLPEPYRQRFQFHFVLRESLNLASRGKHPPSLGEHNIHLHSPLVSSLSSQVGFPHPFYHCRP